jgi:hypothetical protein
MSTDGKRGIKMTDERIKILWSKGVQLMADKYS